MALHVTSGRWRLGLGLALCTCLCWATLPVALKVSVEVVDPMTLTWFRFVIAFGLTAAWLTARGGLAQFRALDRRGWQMLLLAALMLTGNYVFYLMGLSHTTPGNAQVFIQLAPLLMAVGGIALFGERFTRGQWAGVLVVVLGLAVFFADQHRGAPPIGYGTGAAFIALAAVTWAVYALAQKQLLTKLSPLGVLTFIFGFASLALAPLARPEALLEVSSFHAFAIGYCALNTLVAYGSFTGALAHGEASRVSMVLAITPLLTLVSASFAHTWRPDRFAAEHIELLGYGGALLVVTGSAITRLARARAVAPPPPVPEAA